MLGEPRKASQARRTGFGEDGVGQSVGAKEKGETMAFQRGGGGGFDSSLLQGVLLKAQEWRPLIGLHIVLW